MSEKYDVKTTRLALSVFPPPFKPEGDAHRGDEFLFLAITAGEANGWNFTPDVLHSSLPLWDKVECFVDHAGRETSPGCSVRDLGGVCNSPRWDESSRGVLLQLEPFGPAAEIIRSLGRDMLARRTTASPRVGFSADLVLRAGQSVPGESAREVREITRVLSVDLMYNPARGGAFIQPLAAGDAPTLIEEKGEKLMNETLIEPASTLEAASSSAILCASLLVAQLKASTLPAAACANIRTRFSGRLFDPAELENEIENTRLLAASLTGGKIVQGPGRVSEMYDTRDQLQAAADDLFGAEREPRLAGLKPARLSGIRELYLVLTGDVDMHDGYHPDRVRLATTADFSGLVKNSMNKVIVNRWQELGEAGYNWWQRVCSVEHFDTLQQITGTLVGTVGDLPEVAERGEYQELVVGDSPETADWKKYGGYIPLTLELIDRDETRKLKAYPRELAAAGLRKISSLVSAVFTANSGIGPTLADGGALFNATVVTTAGGHKNLLTAALSAAEWDTACTAVYNQPILIKNAAGLYGTGSRMAVNPRFLLVPRQLQLTAMKVLYPSLENAANIYSENMQRGQPGDVVTVPEWTDATNWAAVCDPRISPAIFIGERFGIMPEIFLAGDELSPAVFTHDEHRLKVRHFLAVWVNDFRQLHKSNVAG
jgi:hypothetical protein